MITPRYVPVGHQLIFEQNKVPYGDIIIDLEIKTKQKEISQEPAFMSKAPYHFKCLINLANLEEYTKKGDNRIPNAVWIYPKNGDPQFESKTNIDPSEITTDGKLLSITKRIVLPKFTSLKNKCLWNLAFRINGVWIKDCALDIVLFSKSNQMEKFLEKRKDQLNNNLYELKPFWYQPKAVIEENQEKRPREEESSSEPLQAKLPKVETKQEFWGDEFVFKSEVEDLMISLGTIYHTESYDFENLNPDF